MQTVFGAKWYVRQFDINWVRCMNCHCRAEFPYADVTRKRKCPKCKMDNRHCLPKVK